MMGLLVLFIGCIAILVVAVFMYDNRDKQAYDQALVAIRDVRAAIGSNDRRVAEAEKRVEELQRKCDDATSAVQRLSDELDVFRDQVADTREKQIHLREALSKKRTKVEIPKGPIQIEVWSRPNPTEPEPKKKLGKGLDAILKEQKKPANGKQK